MALAIISVSIIHDEKLKTIKKSNQINAYFLWHSNVVSAAYFAYYTNWKLNKLIRNYCFN
jgi:hypothetical protein